MRPSIQSSCGRLAAIAVALTAVQVMAHSPTVDPDAGIQVAKVTLKSGIPPNRLQEYEAPLKAACGELGMVANSAKDNAQVVGGWSDDQYTNQSDPQAGKKYGNHLTVETFVGAKRTGRWHLYESGSVWVDRAGTGKKIEESCHG